MRHFQILNEADQRWYEELARDIWNYFKTITSDQKGFLKKGSWGSKEKQDSVEAYIWRLYINVTKNNTWANPEEMAHNMALNDYGPDQKRYREIRNFLDSNQQNFDFGQ